MGVFRCKHSGQSVAVVTVCAAKTCSTCCSEIMPGLLGNGFILFVGATENIRFDFLNTLIWVCLGASTQASLSQWSQCVQLRHAAHVVLRLCLACLVMASFSLSVLP